MCWCYQAAGPDVVKEVLSSAVKVQSVMLGGLEKTELEKVWSGGREAASSPALGLSPSHTAPSNITIFVLVMELEHN